MINHQNHDTMIHQFLSFCGTYDHLIPIVWWKNESQRSWFCESLPYAWLQKFGCFKFNSEIYCRHFSIAFRLLMVYLFIVVCTYYLCYFDWYVWLNYLQLFKTTQFKPSRIKPNSDPTMTNIVVVWNKSGLVDYR